MLRTIESKETDAHLVADLLSRSVDKDMCSVAAFEEGFMAVAEALDDISIDAPKVYDLFAIMLKTI